MFAKLYGSIVMSSIWAKDDATRILWITMLAAADRDGFVWGSPVGLAGVARLPVEKVLASLEALASPEANSSDAARAPENEGRRIEAVQEGGWKILNYEFYRDLQRSEDRKAQYRESKRRQRAKSEDGPQMSSGVSESPLSDIDSDSDSTKSQIQEKKTHTRTASAKEPFVKPTLEQVQEYFSSKGLGEIEAMKFIAFYESNGWMVGKNHMKKWKMSAAGWAMRRDEK